MHENLVVLMWKVCLVLLVQLLGGCAQDAGGASLDCQVSCVLPGVPDQASLLCGHLSAQAREGPMLGLSPLQRCPAQSSQLPSHRISRYKAPLRCEQEWLAI